MIGAILILTVIGLICSDDPEMVLFIGVAGIVIVALAGGW